MKTSGSSLVLWVLTLLLCGCGSPPAFIGDFDFELNPGGRTPLAGVLRFSTDVPSRVLLVVGDGEKSLAAAPEEALFTEHEVAVLGLRPGRTNTIEVRVEDERGRVSTPEIFEVETAPLPAHLPPIEVVLPPSEGVEPGVTFVPFFRWGEQAPDPDFGVVLAIDASGEVVWYYEAPHLFFDLVYLQNGNLAYLYSNAGIANMGLMAEIDMLGNVVRHWHTTGVPKEVPPGSIPVEADTFHHDFLEMSSGNILMLSTEVRRLESYPATEADPDGPGRGTNVIGDVLIEFRPDDGVVVRRWSLFDLVDPYRIGYGSLGTGFYTAPYAEVLDEPGVDWSHSNGVDYDAATDSAVISSPHLSAVMKLNLASGELEWILGDPAQWDPPWSEKLLTPDGSVTWSYAHHAPKLTPDGTLMLYDNGAGRAIPPSPPLTDPLDSFSRAVEYRVDEARGTVSQEWSYGGPDDEFWFLSPYISEADWLPRSGNVLVTSGGQQRQDDGSPGMLPGQGHGWITITEVTHTSPARKVWEAVIDDPETSWAVFRSERRPDLYPLVGQE